MLKMPPPPTWPQTITLITLMSASGGLLGNRLASAEASIPARQMEQLQAQPNANNVVLVETLNKLQVSVERLNDTVQTLSTKVAVLEDRGRRRQ